jgi:hypothetical protein
MTAMKSNIAMIKRLANTRKNTRKKYALLGRALVSVLVTMLVACSGGSGDSGNSSTVNQSGPPTQAIYGGPPPQTSEILNFKQFFWDPLSGEGSHEDKCGSCHDAGGPGDPKFVFGDDINVAFAAANTVVDIDTPETSAVVAQVAGGHYCWTADLAFCRSEMIRFIEEWRDGAAATQTVVALTAPALRDPSGSKSFPEDSNSFANTIWPVVTTYCAECHSDTAALSNRQTPYFASADVNLAYESAKSKIDLMSPVDSRLVLRLRDEFHNCWDDCDANADTIQAAIEAFANPLPVTDVDGDLITSKALELFADGIVAASGGRIENDIIALYEFKTGDGETVVDRSSVAPPADLILSGDYDWLSNWGIQLRDGKAQATVNASQKFHSLISATGEYSIEAWIAPANVTQEGPARIVSYSAGNSARNFTLGQTLYNYNFMGRSSNSDANGMPMLSTADADEDLQATLQHVVATFHPVRGREIYVNGVHSDDIDAQASSLLNNWNNGYAFVLGNEVSDDEPWAGSIRMVAIHNRALSAESIQTNYDAGVGQKYFLLFSISHWVNTPDSYIVFEVSQYDEYSYLFSAPYYLSLDAQAVPDNFVIKGMRVGINGKIASVGQVWATLDTQIDNTQYDNVTGYRVSNQGAVIGLENGPDFDQFFLVFDELDGESNVFVEAEPPNPVFIGSGDENYVVAVRNFAEINASFAAITGIPVNNSSTAAAYTNVIQQLPSAEDLGGFLASHQSGITQLAITYCDEMIQSKPAREALNINLDEVDDPNIDDANAKSVAVWDADFIDPMITAALNTNLLVQPDVSETQNLIHHLLFTDADGIAEIDPVNNPDPHGLSRCSGGCPDGQTASAAVGACAALLGSAGVTFQ